MARILPIVALVAGCVAASGAAGQGRVAVLVPGAAGPVPHDFLMRNRDRIEAAGISTVVAVSAGEAAAAAASARQSGARVVIVGMSKGASAAAQAAASSQAAGVVLVSGIYEEVKAALGSPGSLAPALVVHHREDDCPLTLPEAAQDFVRWSGGRARLQWVSTRGEPHPRRCGPFGAHGFYMQDGPAVSAIVRFVRSR